MRCDFCFCTNTYTKDYKHAYHIKGKSINFISKRRFCKECNNLVYDKDLDNEAGRKAIEIYNKKFGIPKEKIIELRKKYNLSQELFSKIIGCAKKTLISYEKGESIPNDNYIIIINSLLSNPETIKILIDANKYQFSDKEYEKIEDKIMPIIKNNTNQLSNKSDFIPTEFNGYTKLNKEKIINMILYFADDCIQKTKLLKEMFYADFIYYKNVGASITGLEYAKINFGPVPDDYEKIINECIKNNLIKYNIEFKNEYEYHNIKRISNIDKNIFTQNEIETINYIKEYFKNFNSKDIVNFSHKEKAFIETEFFKPISYDYAFEIDSL
jgi:putative zinc finger/helix-turn-helix YgiT family protein